MHDDEAFYMAFTDGVLDPAAFDHRAHLRAAACALVRLPFLEACIVMRDGLRRIALRAGRPDRYHETLTVAAVALVADALDRAATGTSMDVDALVARDPGLIDPRRIAARYRETTWASAAAKRRFCMPDAAGSFAADRRS